MRARLAVAAVVLSLVAVGARAQAGMLFGGEARAGVAWFSPNGNLDQVSLGSSTGFTLDYTHLFGEHFAWNLNYLNTNMEATGQTFGWYRPRTNLTLQGFGFNLQFHMSFGKHVEPYLGAGVNYLYSNSSSGLVYGSPTGAILLRPAGGTGSGYWGPSFQLGFDWKIAGTFLFNVEAKYMENGIKMDQYYSYGPGTYFFPVGTTKLRVNPFILSAGIGFRW